MDTAKEAAGTSASEAGTSASEAGTESTSEAGTESTSEAAGASTSEAAAAGASTSEAAAAGASTSEAAAAGAEIKNVTTLASVVSAAKRGASKGFANNMTESDQQKYPLVDSSKITRPIIFTKNAFFTIKDFLSRRFSNFLPTSFSLPNPFSSLSLQNNNSIIALKTFINNQILSGVKKATNLLLDDEIASAVAEMTDAYIKFLGDIFEKVGAEVTNEILELFFEMMVKVGMQMIAGFASVGIKLGMSAVGEIPVVGGVIDLVLSLATEFNNIIKVILPIIKSAVEVLTTGISLITQTKDSAENSPFLGKMKLKFDLLSKKVFKGQTFFGFISSTFDKATEALKTRFKNTGNALEKDLAGLTENILGEASADAMNI